MQITIPPFFVHYRKQLFQIGFFQFSSEPIKPKTFVDLKLPERLSNWLSNQKTARNLTLMIFYSMLFMSQTSSPLMCTRQIFEFLPQKGVTGAPYTESLLLIRWSIRKIFALNFFYRLLQLLLIAARMRVWFSQEKSWWKMKVIAK